MKTEASRSDAEIRSVDILIVGFGLSVMPLLRELEAQGVDYLVLCEGDNVWEQLNKKDRLDFDLVSSKHTSMYTFELVNHGTEDTYPTSKEFAGFIRSYKEKYHSEKVVEEWAERIENHPTHSLVYGRTGQVYKAQKLVLATAFRRSIHDEIKHFDFQAAENKTVVLTTMGDSANMMVSKLVAGNNRIVGVTNGFMALDKMTVFPSPSVNREVRPTAKDITSTVDQLEFHNVRHLSNSLYGAGIEPGTGLGQAFGSKWADKLLGFIPFGRMLAGFLLHLLRRDNFYECYPVARRNFEKQFARFKQKSPFPNGLIAIKYWPVDTYAFFFDDDELQQHIKDGYVLNDLPFFVDQGLVELWPASETTIDRDEGTVSFAGEMLEYDYILEADPEEPNLPPIFIVDPVTEDQSDYQYVYKETFLGSIPKNLHNVFFIGFTRPTTGGLSNIIEMQCLFVHKLVTDEEFNERMYRELDQRLERYNHYSYPFEEVQKTDHLVHYGFFNDEVAKVLGIESRLRDCRSPTDLLKHYLFPNNSLKFRQRGDYEVEGTKKTVDEIWRTHKFGFFLVHLFLGIIFDFAALATAFAAAAITFVPGYWGLGLIVPYLVCVPVVTAFYGYSISMAHIGTIYLYMAALVAAVLTGNVWLFVGVLPLRMLLSFVGRRLGVRALFARGVFNDLRVRRVPKYRKFLDRYLRAYREASKT